MTQRKKFEITQTIFNILIYVVVYSYDIKTIELNHFQTSK